jgi:hypothetical protein
MQHNDNPSEEVFARLCSDKYFGGFVYQNPKFTLDTEREAGDVVLWVRDSLIIFEVIWRNPKYGSNTKSFVKDIGKKRDQLLGDFTTYENPNLLISMQSEHGERTWYDHDQFNDKKTKGVVIVDARGPIEKLHHDTVRLTAEAPLPIAVMTRDDFEALLVEADTVSDLGLYLGDRHNFLRTVFNEDPTPFLTLGANLEQELVGLYKLGDNSFDLDAWKRSKDKSFWHRYQIQRAAEIGRRDEENAASESLDYMMADIRSQNSEDSPTNQHAWEMALLTRRERAVLVSVISRKHERLLDSHKDQKFAFQNQHTGCWDVYYLHHGLDRDFFRQEAQKMANRKLWIERSLNNFQYSVFCFAMRYTALGLREVVLTVSDAHKWPFITTEQLQEAQSFFGGTTHQNPIVEFPSP